MTTATTGPLDEVLALDAVGQADLIRRGEVTPAEVSAAAIARIEQLDPVLNAVVIREFDRAMDAAKRPAARRTVHGRAVPAQGPGHRVGGRPVHRRLRVPARQRVDP